MEQDDTNDTWSTLETTSSFVQDKNGSLNIKVPKQELKVFSPSSLLIESLIQQLCLLMEKQPEKRKKLYLLVCQKMNQMNLIDDTYVIDAFDSIRNHYRIGLFRMLSTAKQICTDLNETIPMPFNREIKCTVDLKSICNWSRYKNEFDELAYIDHGGFGEVFQVRHKLDCGIYAMKMIHLRYKNIKGFLRCLQEVMTLATMYHQNVVCYKAAWLEPQLFQNQELPKRYCSKKYQNTVSKSNTKLSSMRQTSDSSDIVFQGSDDLKINDGTECLSDSSELASKSCKSLHIFSNDKFIQNRYFLKDHATLYIQMQYCHQTLRTWLDNRNIRSVNSSVDEVLFIFKQVVEGVQYIHSKGIVHHDIKPANIFISEDGQQVQVGDFGLSCTLICHEIDGNENHEASAITRPSCPIDGPKREIGTKMYAAPEQLRGKCSPKSDIYSLGILLFELINPIYTGMERVKLMKGLAKRSLPEYTTSNFPHIAELILCMTNPKVDSRPTAKDLLATIVKMAEDEKELSKDKLIEQLKKQIAAKDEYIAILTRNWPAGYKVPIQA